MQSRYTGDIGDFGKLILLRQVAAARGGVTLGVNWYFVKQGAGNNDGRQPEVQQAL